MNVRRADRSELGRVARTLARAFQEDPAYVALFPDERVERTAVFLEKLLDVVYFAKNEVWVTDDLRAAAVWARPNEWQIGLGKQLRLIPLGLLVGTRSILALRMLSGIERKHPRTPHHYLAFLGVDPDAQGRGLGAKVLGPVLERGDDFYLETTNPKNHGFYRRVGFAPIDTVALPAGITATLMLRS